MAMTWQPSRSAVISEPVPPWQTTIFADLRIRWTSSKGRVSKTSSPAGACPPTPVWAMTAR
jgi:hypothetical protein